MKKIIGFGLTLLMASTVFAEAGKKNETKVSLDDLLNTVKLDQQLRTKENRQREQEFIAKKNQQQKLLKKAIAELKYHEAITVKLTKKFEQNEKVLSELETKLQIAMGNLGEMFGVVRQVAGDLRGQLEQSVISAQIPGRKELAANLAERKVLPTIPELEKLWFEMQREMTESGKTVTFEQDVVLSDGKKEKRKISRVGAFNLVSDGKYLAYQPATGQIVELGRQPQSKYLSLIGDFEDRDGEFTAMGIDPTRGVLLSMLVQAPSLIERVQQGGIVGYVILILLFVGLGLTAERFIALRKEGAKIKEQLQSGTAVDDNPLGRIMLLFEKYKEKDLETLELKIDEEILRSKPALERGIGTIKILSAVAPLLGLLGTVTGMIVTFQSITLFGTGDPKLMAGGISQALVTTVLGLVCAIPLLLLYNYINNKSRDLIQILEEQSAGLIASRGEK